MYGLTFNGKHSYNDYALRTYVKSRPSPEPKTVYEDMPGADDELDFSEANPSGRTLYKPTTHEVEFSILERDRGIIRAKAHQIAMWLSCGEQQLIYDDETAVFYTARKINKLDIEKEIVSVQRFTAQFRCRSFTQSVILSTDALQRGTGLQRGYGLRRDMVPLIYNITVPTTLSIYNPGTWAAPLIRVTGTAGGISFTCGGKTLTYNSSLSGGTLEIDCKKKQAFNDGINAMNDLSGEWFELANGNNDLQVGGSGLNCTVSLIFRYTYL